MLNFFNEKLFTIAWRLWSFNSHDELIEGYVSRIISTEPMKIICCTMGMYELACHMVFFHINQINYYQLPEVIKNTGCIVIQF